MDQQQPDTWAVCELMGHVKTAGRLSEEEKFGAKLGRLDVPQAEYPCKTCEGGGTVLPLDQTGTTCPVCLGKKKLGGGFTTIYFGGASVYRITIVTEDVARHVAQTHSAQPVSAWDFPKQLPALEARPVDDFDDDYPETHR